MNFFQMDFKGGFVGEEVVCLRKDYLILDIEEFRYLVFDVFLCIKVIRVQVNVKGYQIQGLLMLKVIG